MSDVDRMPQIRPDAILPGWEADLSETQEHGDGRSGAPLPVVSAESVIARHLLEQAVRAERLARNIVDELTVERLLAFAADCRARAHDRG
jgi:hypothetical protein